MRFVGGNDGRVFAVNPGIRDLGVFEWGTPAKSVKLAKAVLSEALNDEPRAISLYMRFNHRANGARWWPEGKEWTRTSEEVLGVIAAIDKAASEAGSLLAGANRELGFIKPEAQFFSGGGYGQNDTAPDRKR